MAPTRKSFSAKFKTEVLKYIGDKARTNKAAARHFRIDYEQLKRKEGPTGSVSVENEIDIWEENRNEIVIEDLLEVSEEDIGIVLQK